MKALLAHGGLGGADVEVGPGLTILAVFVAVWRRERTTTSGGADAREERP